MQQTRRTTEEDAIRKLDQEWGDAATRYDLDRVVSMYASDGSLVWPGEPAVHGTSAIRTAWQGFFAQFQGLNLQFTAERIDVSPDAEMASDFGKVSLGYDGPNGPVQMIAKYVVVWKKVDGAWKVLYDCYNSNSADS